MAGKRGTNQGAAERVEGIQSETLEGKGGVGSHQEVVSGCERTSLEKVMPSRQQRQVRTCTSPCPAKTRPIPFAIRVACASPASLNSFEGRDLPSHTLASASAVLVCLGFLFYESSTALSCTHHPTALSLPHHPPPCPRPPAGGPGPAAPPCPHTAPATRGSPSSRSGAPPDPSPAG
jgi:hypothetical protein